MKRRRLLNAILLAVIGVSLIGGTALGFLYRAPVAITENASTSYDMLPVLWNQNNSWLSSNGFMNSTANDTRVQTLGGLNKPWMVADNKTLVAIPVPADSQTNLYFVTGESEASAMDIILGYGGYITRADDPDMELGNNFTIEQKGWADTDAGADKNFFFKDDVVEGFVDASVDERIVVYTYWTADFYPDAHPESTTVDGYASRGTEGTWAEVHDGVGNGSNDNAAGMICGYQKTINANKFASFRRAAALFNTAPVPNFTPVAGTLTIYGTAKVDDAGDAIQIAAVSFTQSSNTAIQASDYNVANWGTTALTNVITYAGFNASGANTFTLNANGLAAINLTGVTSFGFREYEYDIEDDDPGNAGGATLDQFFTFSTAEGANAPKLTVVHRITSQADSIESGEHTLRLTSDGSNIYFYVDDVLKDTDAVYGSIVDNGNAWAFAENNSMPYMEFSKITVGGTLIAWYEPDTMISGFVLPDRQGGDENGTINWGANPAGVGVTLGSFSSSGQPSIGATADTSTSDLLPVVGGADWRPDTGVSATLLANPMRPIVTAVSDNTTLSEYQVWVWLGIIFVVFITVLAGANVRGHHLITGIAASAAIILMVVWTVFPLLTLLVVVLAIWGGMVSERSPSL